MTSCTSSTSSPGAPRGRRHDRAGQRLVARPAGDGPASRRTTGTPADPASSGHDRPAHPHPRRRDAHRRVLGPRLAAGRRAVRPGRLRLDRARPRARRGDRGRPPGAAVRGRDDADDAARPAAVRRAVARRAGAGPRGGRDHAPAAPVGSTRSATAVRYLRYPPVGQRGVALADPWRRHGRRSAMPTSRGSSTSASSASSRSSRPGSLAADADEIAALDEVDVLFVGPADLSHGLGIPGRFDETRVPGRAAVGRRRVPRRTARRPGSSSTTRPASPPLLELGFTFIGLGSEGSFVSAGARAMLGAAGRGSVGVAVA